MKEFHPFRLDSANHCLWRGQDQIALTPKAFSVLSYLVDHAGQLVSQRDLLDTLWPNVFVQPGILKTHILDLRNSLGDNPKKPIYIQTLPRLGYRFIGAVREVEDPHHKFESAPNELVGRDGPLDQVHSYLARALAGERQIVFVTGEAGIGKSAFVDLFRSQAIRSLPLIRFARGQCVEGYGGKEPYYPMLEALGQLTSRLPRTELVDLLASQAPTWLVQFPALLNAEHRRNLQREILGATKERMLREICGALESIASANPLLLIFEDLHWVDVATLDLISALARRRSRAKLMLVMTYRPMELSPVEHPLESLKQDLAARQLCREIGLHPLDEPAVTAYLAALGGDQLNGLSGLVCRKSCGNPLFMKAIVEHLRARGFITGHDGNLVIHASLQAIHLDVPESLKQMIERRIARLGAEEQRVLEAASVAGLCFRTEIVAAPAGMDGEALDAILNQLAKKHLMLREVGAFEYEFVHALYRDVLYARIAQGRRCKLHLMIGEELERRQGEHARELPSELAMHFERGGAWQRAIHYLLLAAESAVNRLAHRQSIPFLQHALALMVHLPEAERIAPEMAVLEKLGVAHVALYEGQQALEVLGKLAEKAACCGEIETQVRALVYLVPVLSRYGTESGFEFVERVLLLNKKQRDPLLRAEARMTSLFWRMLAAPQREAHDVSEWREAFAEIQQAGSHLAALSHCHEYGFILWSSTQYRDALLLAQKNLPVLLEAGLMVSYLYLHLIQVWTHQFLGEWDSALDALAAGIQMAVKNENQVNLSLLQNWMAWTYIEAQNFDAARLLCETCRPLIPAPEFALLQLNLELAGIAEAGLGNPERALKLLLEAKDSMYRQPAAMTWYCLLLAHLGLVEAYLLVPDLQNAQREAERFLELAMGTAERTWQARAWEANARVALAKGDTGRAQDCIASGLATINGFEVPLAHWRVHATAADLRERAGDWEMALYHRQLTAATIRKCADSLSGHKEIQERFLSAMSVRNALVGAVPAM